MYYANPEARATQARLRLEQWRKILMQTDAAGPRYADETICELLGSASVAAMAEIESFMRDLVESIIYTINETKCPISSLRPELHILHAHTTFDSIRKLESRNDSYWQSRINITQLHFSHEVALLPRPSAVGPQRPYFGRRENTLFSSFSQPFDRWSSEYRIKEAIYLPKQFCSRHSFSARYFPATSS